MSATDALLAGLLLIAALIAATEMYVLLIRRRERARRDGRQAQADRDAGRRSLLRLGLVDRPRSAHDSEQGDTRRTSRWVQRWREMSSVPSTREDTSQEDDQVRASDDGS
jgi:hypothetical protein